MRVCGVFAFSSSYAWNKDEKRKAIGRREVDAGWMKKFKRLLPRKKKKKKKRILHH